MANATIEPAPHPSEGLNIYQIIDRISNEAGALEPVRKDGVPFAFRGIDGTVAHLSNFMRKYGVVVAPRIVQRTTETSPSGNKVLARTTLLVEFNFYAPDGSYISAITAGEATDYADRSTAQAQSVAFRVALLQTFFLPTHSKDPEETSVEPEAQTYQPPAAQPQEDPIAKGRAAIRTLAGEKGLDYLEVAVDMKLPAGWGDDVEQLKALYKELQNRPAGDA